MHERSKRGVERDRERQARLATESQLRSATDNELDRQAQEKIPTEFRDILKKNRERAQADIDNEKQKQTQTQSAAATEAKTEEKKEKDDSPGFLASLLQKTMGLFSAAKTVIQPGLRLCLPLSAQ